LPSLVPLYDESGEGAAAGVVREVTGNRNKGVLLRLEICSAFVFMDLGIF
jgi:hypothetical protein